MILVHRQKANSHRNKALCLLLPRPLRDTAVQDAVRLCTIYFYLRHEDRGKEDVHDIKCTTFDMMDERNQVYGYLGAGID